MFNGRNIRFRTSPRIERYTRVVEWNSGYIVVMKDGETTIENIGQLSDREIRIIRFFIKEIYKETYIKWAQKTTMDFMKNK